MADEWLTLDEAAKYLKVSKPSIYRFCAEGRLPFFKLAGTGARRFKRSDLDALLEPGHVGAPIAEKQAAAEAELKPTRPRLLDRARC